MDITTNPEVIAAIAFASNVIISLFKKTVLKKYIKDIAIIVPATLSLVVAFASNYGLSDQIVAFVSTGGIAYAISQLVYKVGKIEVK